MRIDCSRGWTTVLTTFMLIGFVFLGIPDRARAVEPKYGGTLRGVGEVDAMGFDALKTIRLVDESVK